MKKDKYYPFLYEKASKHLVKSIFKDGIAFWFEGGDFLKRKYIFKHDDVSESLKKIYSSLVKLNKLKKKSEVNSSHYLDALDSYLKKKRIFTF